MLDSTALIPALGGKVRNEEDRASTLLFEAMVEAGHRVYISTPSVAELLRRAPASAIPRTRSVVVVPFDRRAAEFLGVQFPPDVLKHVRSDSGTFLDYIKYDAMIVACAVRWGADVLVSGNGEVVTLAGRVKLRACKAVEFLSHKLDLFDLQKAPPFHPLPAAPPASSPPEPSHPPESKPAPPSQPNR